MNEKLGDKILTILLYTYILIYPFQFLFNIIPYKIVYSLLILCGYLSLLINLYFYSINKNKINYLLVAFLFFLSILNFPFNENVKWYNILVNLSNQFTALVLINLKKINYFKIRGLYYSLSLFFIFNYYMKIPPENIIYNSSRNVISSLALFYFLILVIALKKDGKYFSFLDVLFLLVVSLYGEGRGGILIAFILFLYKIFFNNNKKILTIGIFIPFILKIKEIFFLFHNKLYYFQSHGFNSSRKMIWNIYVKEIFSNITYLFFGVPYYVNDLFLKYKGNLHNSFFNFHSKFGIFSLVIILLLILKSYLYFLKKKDYYIIFILSVLFIRSCLDQIAFYGSYDLIWFYFFYIIINRKRRKDIF